MNYKRLLVNLALIGIAILMAFTYIKIGNRLSYFLGDLLNTHRINSDPFRFIIIGLASIICAFLVMKFSLKKRVIILVVLTFVGACIFRSQHNFYYYHDHPDFGDMQNVPECLKESNFDTYLEFLNHGCHESLGGLTRALCYKSACWVIVFFLTGWIVQRVNKRRMKKTNDELIDKSETDKIY